MNMTSEAKRALATTIRELRGRLLDDLHAATETAFRLSVRARDAALDDAARVRRARLEAWIAEQLRAQSTSKTRAGNVRNAEDFRREVEKQAAYTLLNRLVLLRLLEAPGPSGKPLRAPALVTGGWDSRAYQDFRALAPALVRHDETEGYAFLLRLAFEDLATELPGLYGPAGIAELVPVPAATLRHVVDALDAKVLETCWTDDMTLGWVYQYWNDPEREALDAKLNGGGRVEPHEIASKTQMFTERYMVDWLLQNTVGPMWLAICQKHGWTPEVESSGTVAALETRRTEWRQRRAAGTVELTKLMPLQNEDERRWAYYVPQPIPKGAVEAAPESLRDLRLIDPAVGSGHFLVVALELLFALCREEARHRELADDPAWSDRAIVERLLSHTLHGIDLDPRAVQIAAAALWLKAAQLAPGARPERLNLVASHLRLAGLPDDDPALVELRRAVERESGIPGKLTDTVVHALRGADHLGSLLKVDAAVDEAIAAHERAGGARALPVQQNLFGEAVTPQIALDFDAAAARRSVLDQLETFLGQHTRGDDLGLRLRGEQLAAGVRFVRMVRAGTYDLVVANPPYQGTAKMADKQYVEQTYPFGKADLYAAFLLRGLELVRSGGVSAMLTMRNWMFIKQYSGLRGYLLANFDLRGLGDFAVGAFDEVPNDVLSVTVSVVHRSAPRPEPSVAQQPTPPNDTSYDRARTNRKRAATLCHEGRHTFDPAALKVVPEWPLVYWWDREFLKEYALATKVGDENPVRIGMKTSNNVRYVRSWFEANPKAIEFVEIRSPMLRTSKWVPYVQGSAGRSWFDPSGDVVLWDRDGLEIRISLDIAYGMGPQCESRYFSPGIACAPIGSRFTARLHRFRSIFSTSGTSVFPADLDALVCILNSSKSRSFIQDINPGVHFEVGDINRIPMIPIRGVCQVVELLSLAFTSHESHREPSVEFKHPGPSPWCHAQEWAQLAVDRPEGDPLPEYIEELDPEPPTDHLSFALGVALGRFGANGEGILDPATADLSGALPDGLLFLDTTLEDGDWRDSLGHPAAAPLHAAWASHGPAIETQRTLRNWLALDFFGDVHKGMYDSRPIHWPLSSSSRSFVAWVNIHRMSDRTLPTLLADHLVPTLARLDGELADLRAARDGADKKAARAAEKRYDRVVKARDELTAFIAAVEQCADRGAPPTEPRGPVREQDARYAPDLDDGVMINSAALWPLLEAQWKDPKKWWKELATAVGRKDYDWSHLAMRYWPTRVDGKCRVDPSLGVAHGCFWRYHPARAWAWELRLQDEIGPDFRIVEAPYSPGGKDVGDPGDGPHRAAFLRDHPAEALDAVEREAIRRIGRGAKRKSVSELRLLGSGLWTAHPGLVWDLELRLSERQGTELRVLAPDEPAARAAYATEHPERVRARESLLANLSIQGDFFEGVDEAPADDDEPAEDEED
jgi:hypothetical protein